MATRTTTALYSGVHAACDYRAVDLVSPVMRGAIRIMLSRAEDWEMRNTWLARAGKPTLPPPYSGSVMAFLGRLNEVRVATQRMRAKELRQMHKRRAKILEMMRPHTSRRVLREREERAARGAVDDRGVAGDVPGWEGGDPPE